MKKIAIAALLSTVMFASNAEAATLTFSGAGVGFNLPRFNTLYGELTSVTFNSRYAVNSYYDYSGNPSETTGPLVTLTGTVGDVRYGLVSVDGVYQSTRQGPNMIGVSINRSVITTFTDGLDYYIGTRDMYVAGYSNIKSSFTPSITSFPTPWSYVSVTYDYVASVGAVPESSTWAMIIVGFGMIGASVRYRRRSTNVTYS
jgi:hypothetical protein